MMVVAGVGFVGLVGVGVALKTFAFPGMPPAFDPSSGLLESLLNRCGSARPQACELLLNSLLCKTVWFWVQEWIRRT